MQPIRIRNRLHDRIRATPYIRVSECGVRALSRRRRDIRRSFQSSRQGDVYAQTRRLGRLGPSGEFCSGIRLELFEALIGRWCLRYLPTSMNSPVDLLRLVHAGSPISLRLSCVRFFTAPLRGKSDEQSARAALEHLNSSVSFEASFQLMTGSTMISYAWPMRRPSTGSSISISKRDAGRMPPIAPTVPQNMTAPCLSAVDPS